MMASDDLHALVTKQLAAAGNVVDPIETAKDKVAAFSGLVGEPFEQGPAPSEIRDAMLAKWDGPCTDLAAVLFPVIEYGTDQTLNILPRCLRHLAGATSIVTSDQGWNRRCAVVSVGRLIWALSAYALHCRRTDAFAQLASAEVRGRYSERRDPVIALREFRHPEVLGGNGGDSYDDYRGWLLGLSFLTTRTPLFLQEAGELFDAADLVIALSTAAHNGRTYCGSVRRSTVQLVADLASSDDARPGLARSFGTTPADLNEKLEKAYAAVEGSHHMMGRPATLFGAD